MLYEKERKDIIRICLEMQEKKYFLGTWGNVSIRRKSYHINAQSYRVQ